MNIESKIYTKKDVWLTIVRSLFNDMKRFDCLVFLSPSISWGRRRACYKASARYVACPFKTPKSWRPKKWEHHLS